MRYLRIIGLVAVKDLKTELRRPDQIISLLFFAGLVLVVFNFAFDFTIIDFVSLGPGILWVAFIFSGVLALSHSFQLEREENRIEGILLAPIDQSAFYLGKVLSTVIFMSAVEVTVVPVSVLMFNYRFGADVGLVILVLILNTVGFAAVGTLLAAMTTQTRLSEMLLSLLLLPVAVPITLAAVKTTSDILAGRAFEHYSHWLALSAAYDLIFLASAVLLFDYVLEE